MRITCWHCSVPLSCLGTPGRAVCSKGAHCEDHPAGTVAYLYHVWVLQGGQYVVEAPAVRITCWHCSVPLSCLGTPGRAVCSKGAHCEDHPAGTVAYLYHVWVLQGGQYVVEAPAVRITCWHCSVPLSCLGTPGRAVCSRSARCEDHPASGPA